MACSSKHTARSREAENWEWERTSKCTAIHWVGCDGHFQVSSYMNSLFCNTLLYRSSHAYQAQAKRLLRRQTSIDRELKKQRNCRAALEKVFDAEVKQAQELVRSISKTFSLPPEQESTVWHRDRSTKGKDKVYCRPVVCCIEPAGSGFSRSPLLAMRYAHIYIYIGHCTSLATAMDNMYRTDRVFRNEGDFSPGPSVSLPPDTGSSATVASLSSNSEFMAGSARNMSKRGWLQATCNKIRS